MSILTKSITTVVTPGSPPTATVPASPAYCVTTTVATPTYGYEIIPLSDGSYYWSWYSKDPIYTTSKTCYPATSGSSGSPGTPAKTELLYNIGWTAGARSIGSLAANGKYSFTAPQTVVGVVTGLNDKNENAGYYEINYGFYLHSSGYEIVENGASVPGFYEYAADSVFVVQRIGTQVSYYIDDTLVYASTKPSSGPLFADASMYFGGDTIVGAALSSTPTLALAGTAGSVSGVLTRLVGFASDNDGAETSGELSGLIGVAESYNAGSATGVLSGVAGEVNASQYPGAPYSSCSGKLTGLLGDILADSGGLRPSFCVGNGVLQPLGGFSIAIGGQAADVQATLQGLRGYAANVATAQCLGELTPLIGKVAQGVPSDGFDWLYQTAPKPTLFAVGTTNYGIHLGAQLKVPKPTLLAYGAGQARLTAPKAKISASGTVTSVGTADLVMPKPVLTISATVTRSGSLTKTIRPQWGIAAYGGGTARVRGPRPAILASANVGAIGRARLVAAWPTLNATAKVGDVVRVAGVLGGMVMPGMGVFVRNVPKAYLRAVAVTAAVPAYEGYSITLLTDEQGNPDPAVTHYTRFPFDRIVRWGSKYYGVAQDGLYELGGDTFDGAPIIAQVNTAESDLGSPELKHWRHLYMGGRMGADLTVSVTSSELENEAYTYTPTLSGSRTRRVAFGRGMRARYFSLGFSNYDGDDFQLDELTPEVDVARRRV